MALPKLVPNPVQIRAYLTAHGWHKGWDIPNAGAMYVFEELSDDGRELTVFVPIHDIWDDYRQRASEVADTLSAIERRPKEAVWDDLCGTTTPQAAPAPAAEPATPPVDPVTS